MTSRRDQAQAAIKLREGIVSRPWRPLAALKQQSSIEPVERPDVWEARMAFPTSPDNDLGHCLHSVVGRLTTDSSHRFMAPASMDDDGVEILGQRKPNRPNLGL